MSAMPDAANSLQHLAINAHCPCSVHAGAARPSADGPEAGAESGRPRGNPHLGPIRRRPKRPRRNPTSTDALQAVERKCDRLLQNHNNSRHGRRGDTLAMPLSKASSDPQDLSRCPELFCFLIRDRTWPSADQAQYCKLHRGSSWGQGAAESRIGPKCRGPRRGRLLKGPPR